MAIVAVLALAGVAWQGGFHWPNAAAGWWGLALLTLLYGTGMRISGVEDILGTSLKRSPTRLPLSDAASAVLVCSEQAVRDHGLRPSLRRESHSTYRRSDGTR
jgi:hypothetical protein